MKKYTKKQIQEAIEYWKKELRRLDEGLFGFGNPVKKFMKELQSAMQRPQPVLIGVSKKNGKTHCVSGWRCGAGRLTFYVDDECSDNLDARKLINELMASGITAKSIDEIRVKFPNEFVHDISGVTVMEATSKVQGRGVIIILNVNATENVTAVSNFFS